MQVTETIWISSNENSNKINKKFFDINSPFIIMKQKYYILFKKKNYLRPQGSYIFVNFDYFSFALFFLILDMNCIYSPWKIMVQISSNGYLRINRSLFLENKVLNI